jgi:hypothetical protein
MTPLPLNPLIVQIVEKYGRIPLSFLYHQLPASQEEVEKQVELLARDGAVALVGDDIVRRSKQ